MMCIVHAFVVSHESRSELTDVGKQITFIAIWILLTALLTAAATLLPAELPLAFDWLTFFEHAHNIPAFYPPWTGLVCRWLSWPLLVGVTLSSYAVAVLKRARSPVSAMAAFLAMPLWWALFLGQLDGLALLGVLGLPWLVPLALMKPQVAAFGIFAQRKTPTVAVSCLLLSFAVWGLWPAKMATYHSEPGLWPQDVALGLLGLPLAFWALWRIPGWDVDKLMLAGAFITPRLIPYNLLPLMPALARQPWLWALTAALASWLPLLANWLGPWAWWLAWVSPLVILIGSTTGISGKWLWLYYHSPHQRRRRRSPGRATPASLPPSTTRPSPSPSSTPSTAASAKSKPPSTPPTRSTASAST